MPKLVTLLGQIILSLIVSITCTRSDVTQGVSPQENTPRDSTVVAVTPTLVAHQIAFVSDRDHCFYFGIYTMNQDGSDVRRLTAAADLSDNKTPAWSPDGSKLAFASDRDGNYEIYIMNVDGSNIARLTENPAFDWEPVWSPDGKRIAFTSNRDGNWEIYSTLVPHPSADVNADSSDVVRLTNNPAYDWQPAWAPDSQHIAFTSDRDGRWEIYVANANGTDSRRLTHPPVDGRDPAWSPDGQFIAFTSTRDRAWEVYTMRADGSDAKRLTHGAAINQTPTWTPDGKRIIYESSSEIMAMNPDGTGVINLTNSPAVDFHPSCSCTMK